MRLWIYGNFVVDAAFEFAALACQFLRIEREVLAAGRLSGYGLEVGNEFGTAQSPAAYAQTAYETGLLTGSDLLHLDPDAEFLGKYLDQLAEIHSFVSYVVEDSLASVALKLHVAYLHVQPEFGSNLPCPYHRTTLPGYGLLPFLQIQRTGLPVYLLEFLGIHVEMSSDHLPADYRAAQGNDAHIVSCCGFYHDQISGLQQLVRRILIESFSGVLEANLV